MTKNHALRIQAGTSKDAGACFDGSMEQWEDCFFTLSQDLGIAIGQILVFCEEHGWEVTLTYKAA